MAHHHDTKQVSFNEATRAWAKIGLLSFGGPTANSLNAQDCGGTKKNG